MQIRRAEAADEEALSSIRRRAILALAVPAMSREQAERWATRGAADRVARAMREHDVWVAVEGAAIGWVEVDRDRVAALYVSPSCSRRGVGSALLTFAETSIRNSGYTTARLESSQNALDYYLRRGYLRCGPADSEGAWPLRKDLAAITVLAQGVPAHIGTSPPGAESEGEDPYSALLPPAGTVPTDDDAQTMRAVVFVTEGASKGTARSPQEYVRPRLGGQLLFEDSSIRASERGGT